ncbi:SDR family NAD(P)-dependent oxidoreductase [Rhodococcus qingshengii]|uniref:SDR family NAD(P)-dependent oxidoreductase n=1 Tax=Rhodococcus TaxID=1827 RepID=UPI001BAF0086|nr:SDR family oxidoreductase [Rhodococcus qingshengii]MBS3694156.1 SDR family oxidoreductase [Rhodococcus qingshengii]
MNSPVAVVTGAEGGLGEAVTRRLLDDGYRLVLGHLPGTGVTLVDSTDAVVAVPTDVTKEHDTRALIDVAIERFGRIDALITLAGVMEQCTIDELDLETWNRTLSVNLTGTFLCATAAKDALRESSGAIITIGSQLGYTGGIDCAAYAASKAGVSGLTRALARQLGPEVRVNCVAPGPIETPMTSAHATPEWIEQKTRQLVMNRFGTADEVATAVAWLAGENTSFVTGQTIHVNGGGIMP